jgi:hypothetical protein
LPFTELSGFLRGRLTYVAESPPGRDWAFGVVSFLALIICKFIHTYINLIDDFTEKEVNMLDASTRKDHNCILQIEVVKNIMKNFDHLLLHFI